MLDYIDFEGFFFIFGVVNLDNVDREAKSMSSHPAVSSQGAIVLLAEPEPYGFFGLSNLRCLTQGLLEPHCRAKTSDTLVLDFSQVRVWDVSALLWLVIALHHYRQKGLQFLLRLPEGRAGMPSKLRDDLDKSADFLRRWRFDNALANLDPQPEDLLVPEQRTYFSTGEPLKFYAEQKVENPRSHLLESLISRRLVNIRNLSDPLAFGSTSISNTRITECIVAFQSERIGDILSVQCGVDKRNADLFSEHLLTEALLNVREHPRATIGMISIAIMGNTRELILCVADNGDPIPETIYPVYAQDPLKKLNLEGSDQLPLGIRADLIDYATQPGITRKTGEEAKDAGMGLTYIREDTVKTFKGKLTIISGNTMIKYDAKRPDDRDCEEWEHSWRGNLLRIAIPLPRV